MFEGFENIGEIGNAPRPPPFPYDARKRVDMGVRDLGIVHEDSWQNLTTGMGDPTRDKLLQGSFVPLCQLDFGTLESLYYGEDMSELIVDALPDECFRRGFTLEGPDAETCTREFKRLGVKEKLRENQGWSRLWGGSAIVIGVDDGATDQTLPLAIDSSRGIKFLNVVDRRYINPITYYEHALSPNFGKPATYQVTPAFGNPTNAATNNVMVHETRLVRMLGTRIDNVTTRRLAGWSYSVLQRPFDVLRLFASAFQAAGQLMNDAGQAVFAVQNLMQLLTGPSRAQVLERFQNLDMQRWAGRMLLIDKDKESFGREPLNIAGADKMLEHMEMRLAAAARMPVTKLMGRSPAGMDATGESDTRNWHASAKAAQVNDLEPAIVYLCDVISGGKWSKEPANKVVWTALEEPNDKDEAEVDLLVAQKWQAYVTMTALSGEQVALIEFGEEPPSEVIDKEALLAVVEAEYELAKDPPEPPPMIPNATPVITNGANSGPQPPPAPPQGAAGSDLGGA